MGFGCEGTQKDPGPPFEGDPTLGHRPAGSPPECVLWLQEDILLANNYTAFPPFESGLQPTHPCGNGGIWVGGIWPRQTQKSTSHNHCHNTTGQLSHFKIGSGSSVVVVGKASPQSQSRTASLLNGFCLQAPIQRITRAAKLTGQELAWKCKGQELLFKCTPDVKAEQRVCLLECLFMPHGSNACACGVLFHWVDFSSVGELANFLACLLALHSHCLLACSYIRSGSLCRVGISTPKGKTQRRHLPWAKRWETPPELEPPSPGLAAG